MADISMDVVAEIDDWELHAIMLENWVVSYYGLSLKYHCILAHDFCDFF